MSEHTQIADLRIGVAALERAVAFFEQHLRVKFEDAQRSDVSPEVLALERCGDEIGAIKPHRTLTGAGLKEATELIATLG